MQSLIRLTKAESVDDYKATLEGRLMAIARANSLITTGRWKNINLRSLVEDELGAFRSQVSISGESIDLEPTVAQNLAMVVHELSTNSIKHGSLSVAGGEVRVAWSHRDDDLSFTWVESGGPPTEEPIQTNTGSAVIAAAVRQLAGHVSREWRPEGLRFSLACKMRQSED